ncbi:MAG: hypothetical protein ACSLEW_01440 [Nocardioides sp.]
MSNSRVVLAGAAVGVLLLAAVASFAIFLPKADGDASIGVLPDTLPNDWTALDIDAAWASLPADSGTTVGEQSASFRDQNAYANQAISEAGVDGVSRWYASADLTQFASVQLLDGPGGPLVPYDLSDPDQALANGLEAKTIVPVAGGTCIETSSAGADGSAAVTRRDCQFSNDAGTETVQITTSSDVDQIMAMADAILD